jgi:hypothetical protein
MDTVAKSRRDMATAFPAVKTSISFTTASLTALSFSTCPRNVLTTEIQSRLVGKLVVESAVRLIG